mmetsp:Transcript_25541/g.71433  ORF Transcript_25541/g.71433 Transcript_25541/m.71433 type:complete len:546 (-) Transcript_25541:265-1902(-)
MASTYVTEPPTKGKVILKTNMGELEIELWPKEAPKAVRNFVQLCMEGFYHGTLFHRIVKDFMIQGGDPTGTGEGSDSIYDGKPFSDEFHSRLRFSHRGLVACANQNAPHTNSCQFFITLDECSFLDRKNTIFGRVVGDTIYNVARMGELEVDDNDRPHDPPVITDIDIVWNPFDDIVPRTTIEERNAAREIKKPKKKKTKKALNLLSFGDDAVEDEKELEQLSRTKIKSAHDAIEDARLLKDDDAEAMEVRRREEEEHTRRKARNAVREALQKGKGDGKASMGDKLRARVQGNKANNQSRAEPIGGEPVEVDFGDGEEDNDAGRLPTAELEAEGRGGEAEERAERKRREKEFRQQLRDRREELEDRRGAAPRRAGEVENTELLTDWQRKRAEYRQRKRLTGAREKETLAKLQKFQKKMVSAPVKSDAEEAPPQQEGQPGGTAGDGEAYDGKVDKQLDHKAYMPAAWRVDDYLTVEDEEDGGLEDLRSHKLVFAKAKAGRDDMARTENLDDYVVFDPLLEKQKEKFNKVQQKKKKQQTEWAGRSIT